MRRRNGRNRRIASMAAVTVFAVACGATADDPTEAGQDAVTDEPAADDGPAEDVGDTAPQMSFEDFDGRTTSMADFEGRPTVVNFWASWCPPCIAEMPDLEAVFQEFDGDVAFLGLNTQDTREQADRLVEQTGVTYDLALDPDGALARAFGLFTMPTTYFVDADGNVVSRHGGILTADQLRTQIEQDLMP